MNQKDLFEVDWSKIPPPIDDGAAAHLVGIMVPPISLVAQLTRLGFEVQLQPIAEAA